MSDTPKPYQLSLKDRVRRDRGLLSLRYGSGKSWIALMAIGRLLRSIKVSEDYKCVGLWFTRNRLQSTIIDELLKHSTYTPHRLDEMCSLPSRNDMIVVGHTWARTAIGELEQLIRKYRPAVIVWDESTKIKSPGAKISQGAHKLAAAHQLAVPKGLRLALTGNPIPESSMELWSQFQFLYTHANPLGDTYFKFRSKWYTPHETDGWHLRFERRSEFWRLVRKHTIYMSKEEWNDYRSINGLNITRSTVRYEASSEQRRLIEQLRTEWSLPDGSIDDDEWYNHTITKLGKALQICNGFYYTETGVTLLKSNPKASITAEIVGDIVAEGRSVIIWRHFREDLRVLISALNRWIEYGIAVGPDEQEMSRFESRQALIIIMPITISEGFNELAIADTEIFFTNTYSQEMRDQAEYRINRPLIQKSPTITYIDIEGDGMRDSELRSAIQSKNPELLAQALTSLRKI